MSEVIDGLNRLVVGRGKVLRAAMEDELIELDVAVTVSQWEYNELTKQLRAKNKESNDLHRKREAKLRLLAELDKDLRELSRPRHGFPDMTDAEYESHMAAVRLLIQESVDSLDKQAAWSE